MTITMSREPRVTDDGDVTDDEFYAEFYADLLHGRRKHPLPLSPTARRLARWQKNNPDTVSRIKERWLVDQGIAPVVGEASFEAPGAKGYPSVAGNGRSSGLARTMAEPAEYLMATNYAAGWNPNSTGSPAPMIGPPIGRSLLDGKDVGFDALSWLGQGLLSTPSAFIMSVPGLGKSTLIRDTLLGHIAQGHVPIIPNDQKNEYSALVEAVGGQVIRLGHGLGTLNPLDPGAMGRIIPELEQALATGTGNPAKITATIRRAKKEVAAAQRRMVETIVSVGRQARMDDFESAAVAAALSELYEDEAAWVTPPELTDLINHLETGSDLLRKITVSADAEEYRQTMRPLLRSLYALMNGVTGEIFTGQTSDPIDVDHPAVVIDVSAIDDNDSTVKSAVMMACWSSAMGAVTAAQFLADVGLRRQKLYAVTLDELWGTLGGAPDLTRHVDALLRLLRTLGMAVYLITHGSKDLETLPTIEDRNRAMGFIDRAGAVICGGLPAEELELLSGKLPFSEREKDEIVSWSEGVPLPRVRDSQPAIPPGRGCFMIKSSKSNSPGVPIVTVVVSLEKTLKLHDTNSRFQEQWEEQRMRSAASTEGELVSAGLDALHEGGDL
ncbi:ATP/GTP-binding protein [Corynebacterium sp. AOP40-9SA-29]|uniref:ATP/GTP-binding protein n=1 Tax=Corynebacterium sp. AOP40-9SA-29 TaxID=3457677 RepID=UPI00403393A3